MTCNICGYQYVGETEQTLAARINGHKRGVRHGSSEEYLHFSCDNTHRNVEINEKFKIQIAEKIFENDNPDKKKAKARRLQRETAWIYRLQTVFPLGLNSRIKGIGSVNQEGKHKPFNQFALSASFDKNMKSKKRKMRRNVRNESEQELDQFNILIITLNITDTLILIRSKSRSFLLKATRILSFEGLSNNKKQLVNDWIDYLKPVQTRSNKEKRLYFQVSFKHKIIQNVNLRRILNEKQVKDKLVIKTTYSKIPQLFYKYEKNIGQTILNYNLASKNASFVSFEEIEQMI